MDNRKKELLNFNVSTYMKDIVGRDLITNYIIAIFELVKNSYDADAKNVEIKIDLINDSILIIDDGHGMSYEDIKDKWLFLAYSEKSDQHTKAYAGSKGIGRFSADRLGSNLTLISKRNGVISKIFVDWNLFQKNQKEEFNSIKIEYEQLESHSILDDYETGTVLYIEKLRDHWDKNRITRVEKNLAALINPINRNSSFNISIRYIDENNDFVTCVKNPIIEILKEKTISFRASITKSHIKLSLEDTGKSIYEIKLVNHSILKNIDVVIYFMNTKARYNFTRIMKENLKDYGNIFIYKNNFRVMPYGEPDYDIFNLNLRKGQGYNRYLASRELLGWISITDVDNHFKEVSSRDAGFIRNEYVMTLEDVYMELIHRPLEDYMALVKFGKLNIDDFSNEGDIEKLIARFKKYEIINVKKYILPFHAVEVTKQVDLLDDESLSKDEKHEINKNVKNVLSNLSKEVQEQEKDKIRKDKEITKLKRELEIKTNIILKEKPERQSYLEHELRKISNEMRVLNLRVTNTLSEEARIKILPYLAKYMRLADKLIVIQQLVLRVDNNTKIKKQKININSYIQSYFSDIASTSNLEVDLNINENEEVIKDIDIFDFGVLIDNIVINAQDNGASKLSVNVTKNGITFVSDTKAIEEKPIEKVFDLGFTTKERGTGMGLFIVQNVAKQFGWKNRVSNLSDNLVAFSFEFGRGKNEN